MSSETTSSALRVERLRIYPVKGGRGQDVERMEFDAAGPAHDRRWMVVDTEGQFVTQREQPKLATLEASLSPDGLVLSGQGMEPLELKIAPGPPMTVRVWDSTVAAVSVASEADRWISTYLDAPRRLVYMAEDTVRETNPSFAPGRRVTFADGYPALVVTSGSLAEVQRRADRPLPLERFRPNILVSYGEAHEEDWWRRFRIGGLRFDGVKLCARCKVTTIDQIQGVLDTESEPLRTLGRYRKIESGVFFGLNAVHEGPGQIRVGDPVEVLAREPVPAF